MQAIEVQEEKARVKALAEAAHAAYPQYDGYFDDWKLVEVINTKGLRARGRRMWDPTPYTTIGREYESFGEVEVFHIGHGWNCLLSQANVRWLE